MCRGVWHSDSACESCSADTRADTWLSAFTHTHTHTQYRHWRSQGGGGGTPRRNWVHKNIPGCVVELNTQNCAWFGSQISLITALSFREAMPPPEPPTRGSAHGPRWGTSVPQTPCAPPPNPGYATGYRHTRRFAINYITIATVMVAY